MGFSLQSNKGAGVLVVSTGFLRDVDLLFLQTQNVKIDFPLLAFIEFNCLIIIFFLPQLQTDKLNLSCHRQIFAICCLKHMFRFLPEALQLKCIKKSYADLSNTSANNKMLNSSPGFTCQKNNTIEFLF